MRATASFNGSGAVPTRSRSASISRLISALPPLARLTAMRWNLLPAEVAQIPLAGRHHGDHGLPVVHRSDSAEDWRLHCRRPSAARRVAEHADRRHATGLS
jgi:hypothetical protein